MWQLETQLFASPYIYLTGVHFRGELQHIGQVGRQKTKCWPIKTREIGVSDCKRNYMHRSRSTEIGYSTVHFLAKTILFHNNITETEITFLVFTLLTFIHTYLHSVSIDLSNLGIITVVFKKSPFSFYSLVQTRKVVHSMRVYSSLIWAVCRTVSPTSSCSLNPFLYAC